MRADGIADDRTIGRVASAMDKLGKATTQRNDTMAFSLPFKRETSIGAARWAHRAKGMLAAEDIKVPLSKAAADAPAAFKGAADGSNPRTVAASPSWGGAANVSATAGVGRQKTTAAAPSAAAAGPLAALGSAAQVAAATLTRERTETAASTHSAAAATSLTAPRSAAMAAAAASTPKSAVIAAATPLTATAASFATPRSAAVAAAAESTPMSAVTFELCSGI